MSIGPLRPRRLLVPYDFGRSGDQTLRVARVLQPQHLHVVHALPDGGLPWDQEGRKRECLERLKAAIAGTGLERATRHALIGDPGHVIGELADLLECDQIVLVAPAGSAIVEGVLRVTQATVCVLRP